jgi:hypothetical protein
MPVLETIRPNLTAVQISDHVLYFSYKTLIAVSTKGELLVSENVWSQTTGKHLNEISTKGQRIPYDDFVQKVELLGITL